MQQLTHESLLAALSKSEQVIQLLLPLPAAPGKATLWLTQFSRLTGLPVKGTEWGADRLQATLANDDIRCLLCMEWLCEAIWLEADAGDDIEPLWAYLQRACQPD